MLATLRKRLSTQTDRDRFVAEELARLPDGIRLLDAGAGSQRFRPLCDRFAYRTQDFGQYKNDVKVSFTDGLGKRGDGYEYGPLDFVSDIWAIPAPDQSFDAVMCTEVLEHVPFPIETMQELTRLLAIGGTLLLTAPSNCLRHMDPFFFSSGYSDRFYQRVLPECGMEIELLEPVGDYYRWVLAEIFRTARDHSLVSKMMLAPAALWYLAQKPTERSKNTACMGYHIRARKVRHVPPRPLAFASDRNAVASAFAPHAKVAPLSTT